MVKMFISQNCLLVRLNITMYGYVTRTNNAFFFFQLWPAVFIHVLSYQ